MFVSKSLIACCRHVYDQRWWLLEIALLLVKCTYNNNYLSSIVITSLRHCMEGCVGIQLVGLRTKEIKSMKVQWKHRSVEEAIRETEKDMQDNYPLLFSDSSTTLPLL